MVWVVIGRRTKTERVPGGIVVERDCPACGAHASFYERRAVSSFRLYFLDVFDYDTQRVMACGACGTLFATDEHGAPSRENAEGWRRALDKVSDAAKRASERLGPAFESASENARGAFDGAGENLGPMAQRASENVRELWEDASEALGPLAKRASEGVGGAFDGVNAELRRLQAELGEEPEEDDAPEAEDDDLPPSARERDPEKAAVLRRFEELEKKLEEEE